MLKKPDELFISSPIIPVSSSSNLGRIRRAVSYPIYPLCCLNELIARIKAREEPLLAIRYLVDLSGHLWLAEEGPANSIIPEHYKMTGEDAGSARCLAAGNITFSDDYKTIIAINHKSGDFRPPFDTMKQLLAILIANDDTLRSLGITLAEDLTLDQLSSSGGHDASYTLKKAALTSWAGAIFDLDKLRRQPTKMKDVSYEPPISARRRSLTPPPSLGLFSTLNFDDEADTIAPSTTPSRPLSFALFPPAAAASLIPTEGSLAGRKRGASSLDNVSPPDVRKRPLMPTDTSSEEENKATISKGS